MKTFLTVLVEVLLVVGLYFLVKDWPSGVKVERKKTPEVHDIARLREVVRVKKLPQCVLPEPKPGIPPVIAAGPNFNLAIELRPGWRRTEMDTASELFHDPNATFADGQENRIGIARIADGGVGRSFVADSLANPLPADECEVSYGKAGSIWAFYPPKSELAGSQRVRYLGYAEAMTSRGERFKFVVASWSVDQRDSLASIVSKAVLNQ